MASSSTSFIPKSFQYDVFLSFRGEDTRKTFVDHLYLALLRKNINTFKDDKNMEKGERISTELIRAIENSRFYMIVFSENYASSSWCLDELVKIMECQKTTEQKAYPIFYDVEPTEVRKQIGVFGKGFDGRRMDADAGKWIEALKEAADLSGWELKNTADGHEGQFIQTIVEEISHKIPFIASSFDENLVGMETRTDVVISSLDTCADDVRMAGIWGIGGGGKTTLARAIFDLMSSRFEHKSFLEEVREVSKSNVAGLKKLQKQMLQDVLKEKDVDLTKFKISMRHREILVVLDDVDDVEQLERLAQKDWFGRGSVIIITTRDEQVLIAHGVKLIHDINKLSDEEAICLFNQIAFRGEIPKPRYNELLQQFVHYAYGHPLTIKVLGSDLIGKDEDHWKETLEKLKEIPPDKVLNRLELSYVGLTEENKHIFLDIACFWKGERKDVAIRALESLQLYPKVGLGDLERKSLITIDKSYSGTRDGVQEIIRMHDRIQDMGREIVRREHPDEPYRRSRLWDDEEIEKILAEDLGSGATIGIRLTVKLNQEIHMKGLRKMTNLKFLHLTEIEIHKIEFFDSYFFGDNKDDDNYFPDIRCEDDANYSLDEVSQWFPNSIQYLFWMGCRFQCLANTFLPKYIVGLEMVNYRGEQLWETEETKVLNKLRFLVLKHSQLATLNLGHITPNLELLSVEGGYLGELRMCDNDPKLKSITFHVLKLKSFDLGETPNLETLDLRECHDLEEIRMLGNYPKLKCLDQTSSHLRSFDLGEAPNLETLDLRKCYQLKELHMLGNYPKLKYLFLTKLESKSFDLRKTPNLEILDIGYCFYLEELHIPNEWPKLKSLFIGVSNIKSFDFRKTPNLEILRRDEYLWSIRDQHSDIHTIDLRRTLKLKELDITNVSKLIKLYTPNGFPELKSLKLGKAILWRTLDLGRTPNLELSIREGCDDMVDNHMVLECPNLQSVELSCSNLKNLNLVMNPHLKTLTLKFCESLVEVSFGGVPELKDLVLFCLDKLETLDLRQCVNLETLSLRNCVLLKDICLGNSNFGMSRLGFLPNLDSSPLPKLRTLYISETPNLEILTPFRCRYSQVKMPLEFPELETLAIDCSLLKTLWLRTPNLKSLDLNCCSDFLELQMLDECRKLKHILITGNLGKVSIIGKIPEVHYLLWLPYLEELIFSHTEIEHFPVDFCKLRTLRVLEIESCHLLEKLPEDLDWFECLEELTIRNCGSLRGIPDDICNLKHLKYLCLCRCIAVKKLPEMLGRLESLRELDIEYTSISQLPQGIVLFKDLRIFGSGLLLQKCEFTSEKGTSNYETFCYEGTYSSSLLYRVPPTTRVSPTASRHMLVYKRRKNTIQK